MNTSTSPSSSGFGDFKTECNRRRAAGYTVTGPKTFFVKEQLKALGGIWDSYNKGWLMPNAAAFDTGLALANPGNNIPAKIAMMAMTTSNSIKVNAFLDNDFPNWDARHVLIIFFMRILLRRTG